ncbi:MAG TPA: hypothetical protein VGM06_16730 [Polyangiaceae bacterium]
MRLAIRLSPAVAALLVPSVALACPYGSGASACSMHHTSLAGYAMWLIAGVTIGFTTFRRR